MKRILRSALGVIFLFFFLTSLFLAAVKFRVSSPPFWKVALDKGGVYEQLQNQVAGTVGKMRADFSRQAGAGVAVPKEFAALFSLDKELSAERFRELIETNIDRLFSYLDGKEKELLLFLPVNEWNLPVAMLGQSAAKWGTKTPVAEVLPVLGMKPEQAKQAVGTLGQIRTLVGLLIVAVIVLLALSLGIAVAHFKLGEGEADRLGGTAWLLMISGFMAKLIGLGAGKIFEILALNSKPPMAAWTAALGRSLVGQFFSLGATIGLLVGIVGLIGVVAVTMMGKQGKFKKEKAGPSLIKRVLTLVLGIILGLVIIIGVVVAGVTAVGGKAGLSVGKSGTGLTSEYYKSSKGWQIKFPAGWEVIKDDKSEGAIKKPVASTADWATIEVGPILRLKEVDGGYIEAVKAGLSAASSLKNAKFAEEPYQEKQGSSGWMRFVFAVDYDGTIGGKAMRLRLYRVEYYPEKEGAGFIILARVPVESWGTYGGIIKQSIDTFMVVK